MSKKHKGGRTSAYELLLNEVESLLDQAGLPDGVTAELRQRLEKRRNPPIGEVIERHTRTAQAVVSALSTARHPRLQELVAEIHTLLAAKGKVKVATPPGTERAATTNTATAPAPEAANPTGTATVADPSQLKSHPYANLLPPMSPDEFKRLREDIEINGLLVPILIYQGKVLDGRNRLRACLELGTKPTFEAFEGATDEALKRVVSVNTNRRQLTASQRAVSALKLLPKIRERVHAARIAKLRAAANRKHQEVWAKMPTSPVPDQEDTGASEARRVRARELAANLLNVSDRYVAQAATLVDAVKALQDRRLLTADLVEQVWRGEVTLSKAMSLCKELTAGQTTAGEAPAAPEPPPTTKPSSNLREQLTALAQEAEVLPGDLTPAHAAAIEQALAQLRKVLAAAIATGTPATLPQEE